MTGVRPKAAKPRLKAEPAPSYDVSGIIGFSGEVIGSLVVSFLEDAAVSLVAAFTGEQIAPEDPVFADAIGELCNMIAGNAKKDFGLQTNITIPNVVIGPDRRIGWRHDVPCVAIPCTTDVGDFVIEISIKQLTPVAQGDM